MRRLIRTLSLNRIGVFELMVALYPIISQYAWGAMHMSFVMMLVLDVMALKKGIRIMWYKPLTLFVLFYIFHELVVFIGFAGMPTYMLGDMLSRSIIGVSIPIIASAVNYEKLVGAFQWVALLCLGGMIYHYVQIMSGNLYSVHPLTLPFFPDQDLLSRQFEVITRPTSFFWEPASYAIFMIIPLFISLVRQNFFMAVIYALSIFLSSSTNGIIFTAILFVMFIFSGSHYKWYHKLLACILAIGLGYTLFNAELFTQGLDKMETTEVSENQRIANGYNLVKVMPAQYMMLGIDAANVNDFLNKHSEIDTAKLIFLGNGSLYVSDFWRNGIKYGIFGLLLLLWMYFRAYRLSKTVRPYILVLLVALFSQSVVLGTIWGYEWIFILSFIYNEKNQILIKA